MAPRKEKSEKQIEEGDIRTGATIQIVDGDLIVIEIDVLQEEDLAIDDLEGDECYRFLAHVKWLDCNGSVDDSEYRAITMATLNSYFVGFRRWRHKPPEVQEAVPVTSYNTMSAYEDMFKGGV